MVLILACGCAAPSPDLAGARAVIDRADAAFNAHDAAALNALFDDAAYVGAAEFESVSFAALCETLGTRFGLEALCARIASDDDPEASLSTAMKLISEKGPRPPTRPELNQIRVWVRQGRTDRSIARLVSDELLGLAMPDDNSRADEILGYAELGETLERILA